MTIRSKLSAAFFAAIALTPACSRSNNLFLGEVNATVGSHHVVVTDCYRFSVDPPQATKDGYRYTPCRDADLVIRGDQAIVNGRAYGPLKPNDAILIDHGVVSIEAKP